MAAMADRHADFLSAGARVFGVSADSPGQNSAVMRNLALPFPVLSDLGRAQAIIPLGFEDEDDARRISRPGVALFAPGGDLAWRFLGRDFADRPDEDRVLAEVEALGLEPVDQASPVAGDPEPGESAVDVSSLPAYLRGARFAVLALRRRHRDLGQELKDDAKAYAAMTERYAQALAGVEERRG